MDAWIVMINVQMGDTINQTKPNQHNQSKPNQTKSKSIQPNQGDKRRGQVAHPNGAGTSAENVSQSDGQCFCHNNFQRTTTHIFVLVQCDIANL